MSEVPSAAAPPDPEHDYVPVLERELARIALEIARLEGLREGLLIAKKALEEVDSDFGIPVYRHPDATDEFVKREE